MKLYYITALLGLLYFPIGTSGGSAGEDCVDVLEERFFYSIQVRVTGVHCTAEHDLAILADVVTDHLVSPMPLPNVTKDEEEIDICRGLPLADMQPCPGYLAEHEDGEASLVWNWKGIGSCGVFRPNPDCTPITTDKRLRRAMDVQRLRGSHNTAASVPDFEAKQWLSEDQKEKLRALARKRDALITNDRRLESTLTESHFISELELDLIMEKNKGNEKLILSQILELYTEYESEAVTLRSRLQELEGDLTYRIQTLLGEGHNLAGVCFFDGDEPLVDIVITMMATEEYAMAYVEEQC